MNPPIVPDLREIVRDRIKHLGWSVNRVAAHPAIRCHRTSVHRWLRGEADLGSSDVGPILWVLGLSLKSASVRATTIREAQARTNPPTKPEATR